MQTTVLKEVIALFSKVRRKPTSYESFERERYNKEVKRLKGIIEGLEEENEHYRQLLDKVIIDE